MVRAGSTPARGTMGNDLDTRVAALEKLVRACEHLTALWPPPAAEVGESASHQIERLAEFILAKVPGEPSTNQGAIDCAIRVIATRDAEIARLRMVASEIDANQNACLAACWEASQKTNLVRIGEEVSKVPAALIEEIARLTKAAEESTGWESIANRLGEDVKRLDASLQGAKEARDRYRSERDHYRSLRMGLPNVEAEVAAAVAAERETRARMCDAHASFFARNANDKGASAASVLAYEIRRGGDLPPWALTELLRTRTKPAEVEGKPDVLRSLSDEEFAKLEPLSEETIQRTLEQGRREAQAATRNNPPPAEPKAGRVETWESFVAQPCTCGHPRQEHVGKSADGACNGAGRPCECERFTALGTTSAADVVRVESEGRDGGRVAVYVGNAGAVWIGPRSEANLLASDLRAALTPLLAAERKRGLIDASWIARGKMVGAIDRQRDAYEDMASHLAALAGGGL